MRRIFVSYSRNNLDTVKQLIDDLRAVGIDTWYDQTLTGGQNWWNDILANIRECEIFIFALSPQSWESEACRSELSYVSQLGKTILPVLVADGINLNLLPRPLHDIQIADYRRRDKDAAFALVKAINSVPPPAPLPNPLPTPPAVPVSYLSTLKEQIDSTGPLSAENQFRLIFELEAGPENGRSPAEVRELLVALRRRDDLLAKYATRIDEVLSSMEPKAPPPPLWGTGGAAAQPAPESMPVVDRPAPGPRLCPQCGARPEPSARFCTTCGAALAAGPSAPLPNQAQFPPPPPPKVEKVKCRRYACAPADAARLVADVKNWLNALGFDSQQMQTEDQGLLVQIQKRGGWRVLVGMSTSLNIVLHQSGDTLTVEIGVGKWIDKAAVGTVSLFILWPLAVTAGFGVWEQAQMPDKIFDYIGNRLAYR